MAVHLIKSQCSRRKQNWFKRLGESTISSLPASVQPCVDVLHKSASREAYELALHPAMSLTNFKILVKWQKINGVGLIDGKDDRKAADDYIHCI